MAAITWPTKNKNGEEDCFAARHPGTQRRCGGVEVARPRYATACSLAAGGRCIAVLQGARADGCGWAPSVSSVREWTTNFGCWFRTCAQCGTRADGRQSHGKAHPRLKSTGCLCSRNQKQRWRLTSKGSTSRVGWTSISVVSRKRGGPDRKKRATERLDSRRCCRRWKRGMGMRNTRPYNR